MLNVMMMRSVRMDLAVAVQLPRGQCGSLRGSIPSSLMSPSVSCRHAYDWCTHALRSDGRTYDVTKASRDRRSRTALSRNQEVSCSRQEFMLDACSAGSVALAVQIKLHLCLKTWARVSSAGRCGRLTGCPAASRSQHWQHLLVSLQVANTFQCGPRITRRVMHL